MAYPRIGATHITNAVTTVECHKQVRSWRLLRSLIELLIPTCNCTFVGQDHHHHQNNQEAKELGSHYPRPSALYPNNVITGTIFGYRKGKVHFCIQTNAKSSPILLLELALPTTVLAKEMQGGFLRIALEASSPGNNSPNTSSLLSTSVWTMYCNSRKVGYAVKRKPSKHDLEALRMMGSVMVGAGIISGNNTKELHDGDGDDEIMYLRANFERVCGSANSESFHLIEPDQSIGQELSIFFYRSR